MTRFGITRDVARTHGYHGDMALFPREEAVAIYHRLYWLRPRFDAVAKTMPIIAAELFDTGVNMDPAVATTFLQRAQRAQPRASRLFGTGYLGYTAACAWGKVKGVER